MTTPHKRANKRLKSLRWRPKGSACKAARSLAKAGVIPREPAQITSANARELIDLFVSGVPPNQLQKTKPPKTKSDKAFYGTWEWKKARYQALKKYGAKCMCCGATERIVVDHIKPRKKYPDLALEIDNLQILCNDCNMGKGGDDETDWRPDKREPLEPEAAAHMQAIMREDGE